MSVQNQIIKCENCNRSDFKSKGGLTLHKKKCTPKEEIKVVEALETKAKDFIENATYKPTEIDLKLDAHFKPLIQQEKNTTLYNKIVKFYEYRTEIKTYENEIRKLEYSFEHKKNIIMREEVIPEASKLIETEWKENVKKGKAPPKKQRQTTIFNEHTKTFQPRFDALEKEIGLKHQRFLLEEVNKLDDGLNLDWSIRSILFNHKLEDIDKDNTVEDIENKMIEKQKKEDARDLVQANEFLDEMLKSYKGMTITLEKLAGTERLGLMCGLVCNGIDIRELARQRLKAQQQ